MSRKSSRALFSSIYENDVCVLGNNALDYTKTKNVSFIDDEEIKPDKKKKKAKQDSFSKPDPHAVLNKGAISRRIVHCSCNKCHEPVEGIMISYIQLQVSGKSIPFVAYTCLHCGHSGHRSVQAKALPHDEFDRLYFP